MNFEVGRDSLIPDTAEGLRIEVLSLRRILKGERQLLAKQWEMRLRDNKAAKGNIKAIKEENAKLRKQIAELRKIVKNQEKWIEEHLSSIGG